MSTKIDVDRDLKDFTRFGKVFSRKGINPAKIQRSTIKSTIELTRKIRELFPGSGNYGDREVEEEDLEHYNNMTDHRCYALISAYQISLSDFIVLFGEDFQKFVDQSKVAQSDPNNLPYNPEDFRCKPDMSDDYENSGYTKMNLLGKHLNRGNAKFISDIFNHFLLFKKNLIGNQEELFYGSYIGHNQYLYMFGLYEVGTVPDRIKYFLYKNHEKDFSMPLDQKIRNLHPTLTKEIYVRYHILDFLFGLEKSVVK
jgi:hypothetical protein